MRHIPKSATGVLEIVSFDDALKAALEPSPEYDVDRWLYVPNSYGEYRYILGTRGVKPLICVGVNPSTAAPDDLDRTLQSVQRVAKFNGYDSFIMFNVYAQRATVPDDMDRELNLTLHAENMKAFDYVLSLDEGGHPAVWAGGAPPPPPVLKERQPPGGLRRGGLFGFPGLTRTERRPHRQKGRYGAARTVLYISELCEKFPAPPLKKTGGRVIIQT